MWGIPTLLIKGFFMTTIVYYKDMLVGDSRYFNAIEGISVPYEKPKIFLSPSKEYAYGVSAKTLPADVENFYGEINNFIERYLADETYNEAFPIKDIHILVMTSEKTFTIYNHNGLDVYTQSKQIIMHSRDSIVAYGSGAPTATLSIFSGSTITEALRDAVLNDPYTGGDLYGVKRSILKGPALPNITIRNGNKTTEQKVKSRSEPTGRKWFK